MERWGKGWQQPEAGLEDRSAADQLGLLGGGGAAGWCQGLGP